MFEVECIRGPEQRLLGGYSRAWGTPTSNGVTLNTLQKDGNQLEVKYWKQLKEQKKVEKGRKKFGVH